MLSAISLTSLLFPMAGTSNFETLSQNAIAVIDEIYGIIKPLLNLVNDDGVYSKSLQKVKSISCTANIIAKYATLLRVSFFSSTAL